MNPAQLLNPKAFAASANNKSKGVTNKHTTPAMSLPTFDPKALLNPKHAANRAMEDDSRSLSTDPSGVTDFGSMIERTHGIDKEASQHRPKFKGPAAQSEDNEPPVKKHKGDFAVTSNKEGPIAEYVHKKREEARNMNGPVVDLTHVTNDNDEDDEITFVKTVKTPDTTSREVCLGMINAQINAHRIPSASKNFETVKNAKWPASKIALRRTPGNHLTVEVVDRAGNHFGNLEMKIASALVPLMSNQPLTKIRFSCMLVDRPRHPDEMPGQSTSQLMSARITVFASSKVVEAIGRALSQKLVFLSNPLFSEGKEVVNPHVPKLLVRPPISQTLGNTRATVGPSYAIRTTDEIRNDVFAILDKMTNVEDLPEMEPDYTMIKCELMPHQKQALWFLTEHEKSADQLGGTPPALWKTKYAKDRSAVFYNVISGDETNKIAETVTMGGIFADMMGLGKTLSVLSRVCATIEDSRESVKTRMAKTSPVERQARGTLIVCPTSVISNWDEQIKSHINDDKVSVYSYHGYKREQDITKLAQYDIVITTYNIVATEYSHRQSRYKALAKLDWYRIVLDEAHMIRNQSTSTYAGCCALSSDRRWAVTGTPVQNRLEDLGALIKFVKVAPFHQQGSFEQHFIAPFKHASDSQVLHNLRLLVDSITLRRSKDKIDLPQRRELTTRLDFSDEERALYECFARDSNRKLNALMSTSGLRGKAYAHMLTFITRLRLLCAHGRELLSDEDIKTLEGTSLNAPIDIGAEDDDKPAIPERDAYTTFYMLKEGNVNICQNCAAEVGKDENDLEVSDDEEEDKTDGVMGYLTPCYHLICPKCIADYMIKLDRTKGGDRRATCPACDQYIQVFTYPLTRAGEEAESARREELRRNPRAKHATYGGPHTKVKALLASLRKHVYETEELNPIEPPIRSVVFSGWTAYLDLIEIALTDAEIGFLRLDGKMSVSARTKVLEQFRTDPAITVILVSIRAGGQGLNFTAANNVYMMEPQFNPGVELQAIDRVHRLGQTRDVQITKFIMADSFEENIVRLQRQKMDLAATALTEGKKVGRQEEVKQRMENLRSLFKR